MSDKLMEEVKWLRGRVEELENIIKDKDEMLDSLASEIDKCNKTISMLVASEHNLFLERSSLIGTIDRLEKESGLLTRELADAKKELASYNTPSGQHMIYLINQGRVMTDCVIRLKNKFGIDRNIDDPKSIVKAAIEAHENLLRDISTRRDEGYREGLNAGINDCTDFIKCMKSTTLLDLYNNYHDSNLGNV